YGPIWMSFSTLPVTEGRAFGFARASGRLTRAEPVKRPSSSRVDPATGMVPPPAVAPRRTLGPAPRGAPVRPVPSYAAIGHCTANSKMRDHHVARHRTHFQA